MTIQLVCSHAAVKFENRACPKLPSFWQAFQALHWAPFPLLNFLESSSKLAFQFGRYWECAVASTKCEFLSLCMCRVYAHTCMHAQEMNKTVVIWRDQPLLITLRHFYQPQKKKNRHGKIMNHRTLPLFATFKVIMWADWFLQSQLHICFILVPALFTLFFGQH